LISGIRCSNLQNVHSGEGIILVRSSRLCPEINQKIQKLPESTETGVFLYSIGQNGSISREASKFRRPGMGWILNNWTDERNWKF